MQRPSPIRTTRSYRAARPPARPPIPHTLLYGDRDPRGLRALAALLVIAVLAGAAVGLYELDMAGKIYPGVRLGGVDVGGLAHSDALQRLRALNDVSSAMRIRLIAAGKVWDATPAQLGFAVNVPAGVDAAYRLGRTGSALQRLLEQIDLLVDGRSLSLGGAYHVSTLRAYLQGLAAQLNRPARPAVLAITPAGPVLRAPAQNGRRLDVAHAAALLSTALPRDRPATIRLPVVATHPAISTASALREQARQARLLAAHITITAPGHSWRLSRADLAAMLRLVMVRRGRHSVYAVRVDHMAVAGYIWPRAASVDRPGSDAQVSYSGGTVRLRPGRDGRVVDRGRAVAALAAAVVRGTRATLAVPLVNGPTVSNAEAAAVAARLRLALRTTVVWLPQRHWAIPPAAIAAALTLQRIPAMTGAQLVPHLDPAALAAHLPGAAALAGNPPRNAAVIRRGARYVVIPAVEGHRPDDAALAAEMLASPCPPCRAVYHLPIATVAPALTTAAAEALARAHRVTP